MLVHTLPLLIRRGPCTSQARSSIPCLSRYVNSCNQGSSQMLVIAILTPDGKPMPGFLILQGLHSLHKKQLEAVANKPRRLPRTLQTQHRTRHAILVSRPSRLVRAHRTPLLTTLNRPRVLPKTVLSQYKTRQANLASRASRLAVMPRAQPLTTARRQQTAPKPRHSLLRAQQDAITSKPRMLLQVHTLERMTTQVNMCILACTASFAVDYRSQLSVPNVWLCTNRV